MKNWVLAGNVLFLMATTTFGQSDIAEPKRWSAYFFAAPGALVCDGFIGTLQFGGGTEVLLKGGLGLAGELGHLALFRSLGKGAGTFSPSLFYQFGSPPKTVPFLTGGYTLAFREGTAHFIHFGAGLNHWFSDRWGLRIEARDHLHPPMPAYHFLQIRVAVLIR